ncbi:MAG: metallophosphoesterase [Acidobacteria bacterium]|nr:metallophosphoesterase [Acidobacteriota bacterium]HPA96323.1 metallophosphoesterase [Thermoanaerobaculia bacterium]HQN39970.1 metallophosphoesterase [Thermoanaerobaculia bacterium]HRR12857.1 metallophosphoesterase [Thermoanaerobaculia bacterium]HRS35236.1 metallophosphoesterase [Thermoanaerobaculia bacterium]
MRRLFHLSDVHFGPHHQPEVARAAAALVAARQPDLVLLSGDLTQRARKAQFRAARAWVDGLGRPVLVVPGNHDVPLYRVWERLFAPFGVYRRHFARDLEPTFHDDELAVIGVNTAHNWTFTNGRIRRRRLARLEAAFAAEPPGRCRIVVAHHVLAPVAGLENPETMRGARRAAAAFARAGVELVVAGHLHEAFVVRSEEAFPGLDGRFVIVHCGTTTSARGRGAERLAHSATWIEIDAEAIALSVLRHDPETARFVAREAHRFPRHRLPEPAAGGIIQTDTGKTRGGEG